MTDLPTNFAELIHPISVEEFYEHVLHRKPLHIPGAAGKVAGLMDWATLDRILNIGGYWTGRQLQLALDTKQILPERYCRPAPTVEGERLMVDPARVEAFLADGASLVCNTVDGLTPELNQIASILEDEFLATAQGNLYCSFKQRKAFDVHYDTHDVFALHTEGKKVWRIYEARLKSPMAHPALATPGPDRAMQASKKLLMEVTMRPGDLLYIPRGQYHDAMASTNACIHVAFGVIPLRGYELLSLLENEAVADPFFRADAPADGEAFGRWLDDAGARLANVLQDPEVRDRLRKAQYQRRRARGQFNVLQSEKVPSYKLIGMGLRMRNTPEGWALSDTKQSVLLPAGTSDFVQWVLSRPNFTLAEAETEFSHRGDLYSLLDNLEAMKVVIRD